MVRERGLEPRFADSKSAVLPLDDSRVEKWWEYEDSNLEPAD